MALKRETEIDIYNRYRYIDRYRYKYRQMYIVYRQNEVKVERKIGKEKKTRFIQKSMMNLKQD